MGQVQNRHGIRKAPTSVSEIVSPLPHPRLPLTLPRLAFSSWQPPLPELYHICTHWPALSSPRGVKLLEVKNFVSFITVAAERGRAPRHGRNLTRV